MAQFRFKGCPRCGGDMHLTNDGWHCLHCGHGLADDKPIPKSPPDLRKYISEQRRRNQA